MSIQTSAEELGRIRDADSVAVRSHGGVVQRRALAIVVNIVLIGIALISLLPLIYMVSTSLKAYGESGLHPIDRTTFKVNSLLS